MKYSAWIEFEAPNEYNVGRATAAVALALTEEPAGDLEVTSIKVEVES